MFLQGHRVSSSDNPHQKLSFFQSTKRTSKTNAEREEEEFQRFLREHKEKREKGPSIPVHTSHANRTSRYRSSSSFVRSFPKHTPTRQSRPNSARSTQLAMDYLEQTINFTRRDLSVFNTDYHHRQVVLKQNEVDKYQLTLDKITISEAPLSGVQDRQSLMISPKDVLASSDHRGNITYDEYITALRYQEVLLLEKKKRMLAEQQKKQRDNVVSTLVNNQAQERWYELKDNQFTQEISKFNDMTL